MLPAPPASCAGWWFTQLWRALIRVRPAYAGAWLLEYPEQGTLVLRPRTLERGLETIAGVLREGMERRCEVSWQWPGDDGMLHTACASWQPGAEMTRPLEWSHRRRPLQDTASPGSGPAPWPLSVSIFAHGWHGQLLEFIDIAAVEGDRAYPINWDPPVGNPRLPRTDLPCALVEEHTAGVAADSQLTLAGLSLPWIIDVDRSSWAIWRRLSGVALLDAVGGAAGACPRHGMHCSWPATGRTS